MLPRCWDGEISIAIRYLCPVEIVAWDLFIGDSRETEHAIRGVN